MKNQQTLQFRQLSIDDKAELEELITLTESTIKHSDWWLPISDISRQHFFDEEWTCFYGGFLNEKLISASALFFNENEFGESRDKLGIGTCKIAEIGRCMVNPENQGNNLMFKINSILYSIAKEKEIQYLIATAHPDNLSSCKSLEKLGFVRKNTILKNSKYLRNIYLAEVN
jgi:RimJ/RimL family protein N-acetyltransferase